MTNSSWRVGSWTTPTTTVTQPPVPSEVSPESRSKISTHIAGQFPSFIRDEFPTFIDFVKEYYKSQELKGYCIDIIQNWSDYYNIDNYGDLVTTTTLISTVTTTSTAIDVESTRDFPSEGLLLIDDEIIYYQKKGSTLFQDCARGFNAVRAVGIEADYRFESTTAAHHALGTEVVNLNNIFPLYMLGKFKEQFLATYPKNFADGVTESTIIKRIKDFYSSKGTGRSFQFVLRTLFGVESEVSYPRERIFKPSDAFYTSREIIRATPVSGNPIELVGQVLYQEADPNDPNVDSARIYVKGVVEVFTASGTIYEIDVDTNNSLGTFVTPYKTVLSQDLGQELIDTTVTVDSTLGWPELNGKFRIEDEIISYTDKTVTQFLGCTRAIAPTVNVAHDAGQEVFAAFKIFGYSNVDGSEIQLKVFGGTRGVKLNSGGKYYLPDSKVTTPAAPGFDSLDPIWDSFIYNVRRALRGVSATLGQVETDGSVRCTVVTKEKHRLVRDDTIRILNAPEDIYNNNHIVVGIVDEFTFEFIFSSSPAFGISGFEFFIAREFAFGRSDDTSINIAVRNTTGDVQNTYKSDTDAIIASTGIPTHKIGPFAATDLDPGNQRYLKRIPLVPTIKSQKTATPVGQIGIGANGVPLFSYKSESKTKYGGIKSIETVNGGSGYDITNPPTVQFEPTYQLDTTYAGLTRVQYNGNRYQAVNAGKSSATQYPVHTIGQVLVGEVEWLYEGSTASADVSITGSVTSINVTSGGSGYTTEPIVSIVGGGAVSGQQAFATAQITDGSVTGINIVNGGSGYTSVPTVSISGGGGSGATASAVCRGPIDSINITNAGSQYTYEPTINLISGSGAVAYPSIINGKIESIIVTFGGSAYFGPPDVIITGDGVGATAFATVDLTTNIVTGITVSSKGVGYTAGSTRVSIVYPGSGAIFQTRLTELSVNEAATGNELGSNTFVSPKTTDPYGGACFQGENFLIYSGEYGYLYNPKQIRFLLKDSIGLDVNNQLQELPPTIHSPIIGWAYDGHPIYGPYGYVDPENKAPFNEYKRIRSSYRVKTGRDALLSGLSDPLGTYIEDYEYVEGLGDLDRYNGRFCVTPEYPNGVYAYFTTITGTDGFPAFPYFIGPEFYGEADKVNWDGNGLQKNFTEDAIRYRAPFVGVDNIVAKRKVLDNKVDFFLALEDSTTLIVMETGETLTYIEDGIGYYSYYPFVRGGTADSLVVSATNKYSSAGVDQYLVEGGGKEYKVNDRLEFDNTGTGGEGVSATVAQVQGADTTSITVASDPNTDVYTGTVTTSVSHLLQPNDSVNISTTDNTFTRTLTSKVINGNYHFKYFALKSMKLLDAWTSGAAYVQGDLVHVANRVYVAASSGTSGASTPTHTSGTTTDGDVSWTYLRIRTDGNLFQDGWSSITGGSNYANGTYLNVPIKSVTGDGLGAKATILVQSNAVTEVTITDFGYGYDIGDEISADNINLGNAVGGTGFSITLTQVQREVQCHLAAGLDAHQLKAGDLVNISGVSPTDYNKANYIVIRTESLKKFTVKRNFAAVAAANVTSGNSGGAAEVYINEPNISLILGHSYIFDTSDTSNNGRLLSFTLDPDNTDVLTYKNVIDEVRDEITDEQDSITLKMVDLPGIFYYHDVKHENVSPNAFTVIVQAKTTAHPYYNYGSGNGYYITGDKYGSVTESPAIAMSRGVTYTFNQTAASNNTHGIYFSESEDAKGGVNRYEKGVVYKINGDAVSWDDYNSQFSLASTLSRSVEITPAVDSPNTLYYVCQNHLAMGNAINVQSDVSSSRFFNVINDPVLGSQIVTEVTSNTYKYTMAVAPEIGYSTGVSYATNSIYPSGGIATITIGDQGRNYQSLPKLSGSSRSGSGAVATATISGGLSNVSITNQGSGYNQGIPPTCVVTLPDFIDITLENVLGNFLPDEIVISKEKIDNSTARGKVLSWNPITSVLRIQPLQNTRTGAGQKGYIMFNSGTSYSINPSQIDAVGYADHFEFASHNAKTGDPVLYVSAETAAVSNMTVGQTYYIIDVGDANRVKLAETPQLAEAGTAITITNSGTDTQVFLLRSRIYTGGSTVAVINSLSGTQSVVTPVISGLGKVLEVNINTAGTNYRAAPNVIFDDPYFGTISTVSIQSQTNTAYTASQTFTGITQKSIAGTSATGAEFTFKTDSNGTITTVTVTNGGTAYNIGDDITISGADLGGTDGTHDVVLDMATMSYPDVVSTATLLDASLDSITVTNSGSGYLSAPTITAQGGNGINASLNALIVNQGVSNIQIEEAGQQFQSAPIINIEQKTGSGASILLKSSNLGEILKISGDNITFNYSHDRTLKPNLNTTYNLQLIRTQIIDYFDVINGGANFVSQPEIILEGGQGSLFELEPLILNEVIQSVLVNNPGRGFTSAPTVKARVAHSFVALNSNSTFNFPYNAKIPTGTKVNLVQVSGILPPPFVEGTTYYAVAATTANGLANNQIKLATSLANANTETTIAMTGPPLGDPLTGQSVFQLQTTDLGDNIIAYMKPATFSIGERIYQGASTTSYTAYGVIKNWDASGRVVSVELIEGDFVIGQPVFGEESAAFGQIHAYDRADANFEVSPISTSSANWEKTTGFLDLNEQRVYDSNRFQEFSYDISSSVNISDWRNPLKFAAHPAGFKVVGTQVLTQSVKKDYRPRSVPNQSPSTDYDWWIQQTNSVGTTFNGTTFITPKPSSKRTAKLATINNFALSKPDYTALVPTEVSIYGKQLLDVQKILSCISYKIDDVSDRTVTFDGSSSSIVDGATDRITITNHAFVANQLVTYTSGGDRFLDARDLIVNNIDYIIEESIGFLNATYPSLNLDPTLLGKCARDTRLVVAAWTNDLKYGGNYFSRDAAEQYTNGTNVQHVQGEESETVATFNKARDLCLLAVTNDLPVGTYTNIVPQTDLSITNDAGGCADVKSAINTLAGIVTNAIDNPSDPLPTQDIGNYPNNRFNTPIGGLSNNGQYYIRYVDANTIELSATFNGAAIDLTSQGGGIGHALRCFVDGTNNQFRLQCDGVDLDTKIGKTAATSQLLLSVNGLIANPATYTLANSIVTFVTPPLSNTRIIAMYFDRSSYTDSFVLDQIGDEVKTLGTGYSGTGTHTFVSGSTNGIVDNNGAFYTAQAGTTYDPLTGLMEIEIGSHSLTTSNKVSFGLGVVTFTCDADNHASEHSYPRTGDPVGGAATGTAAIVDIEAVTSTTITVNVGVSNDEPNELAPGNGYSDYTYAAVPLKNRLGGGVGVTADITVTGGKVTNAKVVSGGNGYNNTDVLGIADPRVGEQFVKHFIPSTATYTPASGDMVLTIGAGHNLSAPTTHTPTFATYDPNTGLMVVTINNHGRVNGDQVKFDDGAIRFSCTYGGGGNDDYPRSTDYASDRWLQVFDCTTNTFTVQVLDSIPSTDLSPHTYVSAVTNSVKFAVSTVRIANESLRFSCPYNGGGTAAYPRATDPIGTQGKMRDIPVEAVASTTITVNALNGTAPTNTDAHTWEGLSTYQFQPTGIAYTPSTGEMVVTITGHPFIKGDRIQFATNSLSFTCAKDNNATTHTYPRVGDPAEGAWHTIDAVNGDDFTVFVGESSDTSAHTFTGATATAVTRAVVSYGVNKYSKFADAGNLLRLNQNFIATTAYGRMQADNPSFSTIYKTKCIRDTNLLIDAVADNVEFGGNDATYDAANFYVGTVHLSGEEGQSVQVFNHARDICRQVMRNLTVTTNSDTVGTQIKDNTISNDSGSTTYSEACCIDVASTITTLWGIVTQAVGTGAHTWGTPGVDASNALITGGNYAHTFVSAVANGVTSNVGNLPNPVTGAVYTPSTGNLVITSNAHNLTASNTVTIADNALTFTCAMDNNATEHSYPRSTDPASGQTLAITNPTTNTFTVNVGASPIVNFDVESNSTYDNATGILRAFVGASNISSIYNGDFSIPRSVKLANGSIPFTCENDNNTSVKYYPRPSDPYYDTAITIVSSGPSHIDLQVGTNTGNLNGITRTASQQPSFQIGVSDVAFDGIDKTFTMQSGGSTQVLPASDNFLIFLNSTLQLKGTTEAYTYTGSQVTFSEAPLAGMDFYGFYFGKLTQLDEIAPFFDNKKKTFTMKENTEPFSLESDNAAVEAQNNLIIFLNGVYQEPGVAYQLTGSIIEFSEAPRAGSDCTLFIYTGSASDILVSNTFNSIDPEDRVQISSEGSDRRVATISSSTTIDSYEYTGLRPTVAEFTATVTGGQVTQVTITNPGSNYEVPPILLFQGGGGEGAAAETVIEVGSGRVLSVINLNGGSGYTSAPTVLAVHPLALERKQRNRIISNSLSLGGSYLSQTLSAGGTTINLKNVYFNSSQKAGFPDEGEVLIPFYNTAVTPPVWTCERILYGAKDVNANTLTVATGGRGFEGTTAAAHPVITGTYSSSGVICTVNTSTDHNLVTGQRFYLDFTTGTGFDGLYTVTVSTATQFTVEFPFSRTASGDVSLLPEVRLRSL